MALLRLEEFRRTNKIQTTPIETKFSAVLLALDCLLDYGQNFFTKVGLLKHSIQLSFCEPRLDLGGHITAGKNTLKLRIDLFHQLKGLPAIEFCQTKIKNCQPDLIFMTAMHLHRFDAVLHRQDFKSFFFQQPLHQTGEPGIVLGIENRLTLPRSIFYLALRQSRGYIIRRCFISWNRQINMKGRTAAGFTGCLDEAGMFTDDIVNY